ncbi:hypothetical protein LPJ53_002357 [Coemansia erecta]|uniref:SMP-30/Gluconolactonase/LRE-like region domain-containing protein n=1 Tax=Coemansia erecta TaxID=147472 RepID=A0A9W7Y3F3_9FUNG|nr:hypothetical protein LPJ53_002357 [Coemansia erecta]
MKLAAAFSLLASSVLAANRLQAVPFLGAADSLFGAGIEGAGVDRAGNIYAVDFNNDAPSAGQIAPTQELLLQSSNTESLVNGIRFNIDSSGAEEAYIADATIHQVIRLSGRDGSSGAFSQNSVFCHDDTMLQPNDIAIAPSSGRVFLSGMNWTSDSVVGDGDLWTCDSSGAAKRLGTFKRTNGVEVSPDEKTLYLSEATNAGGAVVSNVVLAFDLDASTGDISNQRVFADFAQLDNTEATDIDGMRTDENGNLYVTRNGIGQVAVFAPTGELTAYINATSIDYVANLEFGGASGTDLYIIGRCKEDETKGCADVYQGSAVGRAFRDLQTEQPAASTEPTETAAEVITSTVVVTGRCPAN